MEIRDIVKTEKDRVFILDYGCYIVFTGNTLEDSQPFIRLGNWPDLPVDLIPLVENIIITDTMTGNPALEQFNIDINTQSSNRYIGSHTTLQRFLTYQKIFGLDLKNVAIVDVENDIPDINGQNISDRESFIGIFYRDGNFKIKHARGDLFDLHKATEGSYTLSNIQDDLYDNVRSSKEHADKGFIFTESGTVFFSDGHSFLDSFPRDYLSYFSKFNINAKKVSAIAHPSVNYIGLSSYLSWLNTSSGKISILTDEKEQFDIIKKLFSKVTLTIKSLSGIEQKIGSSLHLKEINKSYELIYSQGADSHLVLCYTKDSEALNRALKNGYDALVIPYKIFEEKALLLKSSKISYLVVDDGSSNFRRVTSLSENPVFRGITYTLRKIDSTDTALNYFTELINAEEVVNLFQADKKECAEKIEEYFEREQSILNRINFLTMVRFFLNITSNRKLSSALNRLLQKYGVQNSAENLVAMNIKFRGEIILAEGGIFITYQHKADTPRSKNYIPLNLEEPVPENGTNFKNKEIVTSFRKRVLEDRERLMLLIALYIDKSNRKRSITSLKKAISERKEIYKNQSISKKDIRKLNIDSMFDGDNSNNDLLSRTPHSYNSVPSYIRFLVDKEKFEKLLNNNSGLNKPLPLQILLSIKKTALILVLLLLLFLIGIPTTHFIVQHNFPQASGEREELQKNNNASEENKSNNDSEKEDTQHSAKGSEAVSPPPIEQKQLKERLEKPGTKEIIKKYDIKVTDTHIFNFVNEITKLNGYAPILSNEINGKNPHWIYPDNVFNLPDAEKIIVREGDSLWKIAELKLTRMAVEFFQTVEKITQILEKDTEEKAEFPTKLFTKAETLIYTEEQKELLNELKKKFQ